MKGSKEAVQVAAAASLPLVHVGGGETDEMQRQANKFGAELIVMPRIDEMEIVALMRNAHADCNSPNRRIWPYANGSGHGWNTGSGRQRLWVYTHSD